MTIKETIMLNPQDECKILLKPPPFPQELVKYANDVVNPQISMRYAKGLIITANNLSVSNNNSYNEPIEGFESYTYRRLMRKAASYLSSGSIPVFVLKNKGSDKKCGIMDDMIAKDVFEHSDTDLSHPAIVVNSDYSKPDRELGKKLINTLFNLTLTLAKRDHFEASEILSGKHELHDFRQTEMLSLIAALNKSREKKPNIKFEGKIIIK